MIIIPKRSVLLGHVPTPDQLEEGEIAILQWETWQMLLLLLSHFSRVRLCATP